jgi:ABC-type lipoprotein export system ATPase subunit
MAEHASGEAAFVALEGVSKRYAGAENGSPLSILRDIHLRVRRGESLAIVGPSGSGKTTLLNLLGTLDRPDDGRVILDGVDLARLDERELARTRNAAIGFVFQFHYLLPHLTLLENVLLPTLASADRAARGRATGQARQYLERVGLKERLNHRPGQLSGGERQRVAVVRALINQPKLLLADEPTGALDQDSARDLGRLLRDLNREEGVTLIVVTHSLELAREMQRVCELRHGKLIEQPGAGL